eukprot:scaffold31546_cov66-Phaeocystis_antarctica.AAC.11
MAAELPRAEATSALVHALPVRQWSGRFGEARVRHGRGTGEARGPPDGEAWEVEGARYIAPRCRVPQPRHTGTVYGDGETAPVDLLTTHPYLSVRHGKWKVATPCGAFCPRHQSAAGCGVSCRS